jgi:hypothetical protein
VLFRSFIPNAYSFEEMKKGYDSVADGLSQALRHQKVLAAAPYILHLRPRLNTPASRLVAIPKELKPKTRYYGRFLPETRRTANLTGDLVDLIQAQEQGLIRPHILLDGGMSIARIISLGIARGYSSIVLVGVDLNTNRYFFEEDPSHLARHGLTDFNPWISRTSSHDTEQTEDRNFAASEFLAALARASETIGGPTLSVLSSSSKLAESLPLYQWPRAFEKEASETQL